MYVLDDERCGCGGERQHGCVGLDAAQVGDVQVGGPEVVAPLADAVGFVNGDETHAHVAQLGLEQLRCDAFGRDVEQLDASEDAVFECLDDFGAGEAGMDGGGAYAVAAQVLHLVFHQGDERGDDNAHALLCECRHLECDALAAACWHEPQCVVSTRYALDDFALYAAEIVVAPVLFQDGLKSVGHRSSSFGQCIGCVQPSVSVGRMSSICSCTSPFLNTLSSMV